MSMETGKTRQVFAGWFWGKIDGEGIDNLEVLKDVAQQMDLKKLATLAK